LRKREEIAPERNRLHQRERDCAREKEIAPERKRLRQRELDCTREKEIAPERKRLRQRKRDFAREKEWSGVEWGGEWVRIIDTYSTTLDPTGRLLYFRYGGLFGSTRFTAPLSPLLNPPYQA
jgi:hypothetical protein